MLDRKQNIVNIKAPPCAASDYFKCYKRFVWLQCSLLWSAPCTQGSVEAQPLHYHVHIIMSRVHRDALGLTPGGLAQVSGAVLAAGHLTAHGGDVDEDP